MSSRSMLNFGRALHGLGASLMGASGVDALAGTASKVLTSIMLGGWAISMLGTFFVNWAQDDIAAQADNGKQTTQTTNK